MKYVFVALLNILWSIVTLSSKRHYSSRQYIIYQTGTKLIEPTRKRGIIWSNKFGHTRKAEFSKSNQVFFFSFSLQDFWKLSVYSFELWTPQEWESTCIVSQSRWRRRCTDYRTRQLGTDPDLVYCHSTSLGSEKSSWDLVSSCAIRCSG